MIDTIEADGRGDDKEEHEDGSVAEGGRWGDFRVMREFSDFLWLFFAALSFVVDCGTLPTVKHLASGYPNSLEPKLAQKSENAFSVSFQFVQSPFSLRLGRD